MLKVRANFRRRKFARARANFRKVKFPQVRANFREAFFLTSAAFAGSQARQRQAEEEDANRRMDQRHPEDEDG